MKKFFRIFALAAGFLATSTAFGAEVMVDQKLINCSQSRTDSTTTVETQNCTTASTLPEVRLTDAAGNTLEVAPALNGGSVGVSIEISKGLNVGAALGFEHQGVKAGSAESQNTDSRSYAAFVRLGFGRTELTVSAEHQKDATTAGVGSLKADWKLPLHSGNAPYVNVGAETSNGDVAGRNASSYGIYAGMGLRVGL